MPRGSRLAGLLVALGALIAPAATNAAFGGANGRIFFDTGSPGREIASISPEGDDRRSIAQGSDPAVAPDGREIAYVRGDDLYLASRDGSDELRLTNSDVAERAPSFSPSGNKLVYATKTDSSGPGRAEPGHVFTIGLNDGDRTRLTQSDATDSDPSYSPSGNKISFTRPDDDGNTQLMKMNADGSNRDQLTTGRHAIARPSWSPDGSRIAFSDNLADGVSLYSVEPDGSDPVRLTFGGNEFDPSYSPSGNKIVYSGQAGEETKALFVMHSSGLFGTERLTAPKEAGADGHPYWGPVP